MGEDFEEEMFPEYETVYEYPDEAIAMDDRKEQNKENSVKHFEVGDWVTIRNDFDKIRFPGDPGVNSSMLEEKGKLTQIRKVLVMGKLYKLEGDTWSWHRRWLDPYDTSEEINIEESDIMALLE